MKYITIYKKILASLHVPAICVLTAGSAGAVDLMAVEGTWTSAGGEVVPMWGFAADAGSCPATPIPWAVGPEITEADLEPGGDLIINLRNCLSEPTSIIIAGQSGQAATPVRDANGRITAFTSEAPSDGGATLTQYRWTQVSSNPGAYLYTSGSHIAKQVQMGLYGAVKIGRYPNTSGDLTLLYSEIDPALHTPPAAATPLNYKPRHFLVNGAEEVSLIAGNTNLPTVLSFLNAGLDYHVPALNKGYMTLQAEDGNTYPFAREQYSVNLPAGKTMEAFWHPQQTGEYVIYDRKGNNMIARLTIESGSGAPVAVDDSYSVDEDIVLIVAAPGVLTNDTQLPATAVAELITEPAAGTLSCAAGGMLCVDGSFDYTPNANFAGGDSFTYRVSGGAGSPQSNNATVSITVNPVNDAPVGVDDAYVADSGVELAVTAPGVLANDTDIDGDTLVVGTSTLPGGVNSDGSFVITTTVDTQFTYEVCDSGAPPLCSTATVDITVNAGNDIPVAVDDFTTVRRNSRPGRTDRGDPAGSDRNTFSITVNDTDANGIDSATVAIAGEDATGTATTSRGGTVVDNGDGTVAYTPPRNFRGTDTFTYTVDDTLGATSNVATVRINVVRRRDLPPL